MKLHSRDFERRLRSAAQREMRHDRSVWKDYRRHRPGWIKRSSSVDVLQSLPYLYFGFILVLGAFKSGRAEAALLGVAIYASYTTIFRGFLLRSGTLQGCDRAVLVNLPISDERFLQYEITRSLWSWLRGAVLFLLAYGAIAIGFGHFSEQIPLIVVAALLQATCGVCLAMWLIAFFPVVVRASVSTPLYALVFICLWLPAGAVSYLWSATLFTPGGWISHGFGGITGLAASQPLWLVPAFVLASSLPFAYKALRQQLLKELGAQTLDELASLRDVQADKDEEESRPGHVKPDSPDSDVWKGHFLEGADWSRSGWIEQLVARFLNRREMLVAEFMLGDQLGAWSKRWRTAALITAIGLPLSLTLGFVPALALFLPLVAAAMWGAPLFGGFWWGFSGAPTSGYLIPAYAGFPVGYSEISRVMLKANVLRVFAWSPLGVLYITALTMKFNHPPAQSLALAVEVILLILAVQPVMIAGHFSIGSDDTKRMRWQTCLFFTIGFILFVVLVLSAMALFQSDDVIMKGIGTLGVFVVPVASWWGYKLIFNSGGTDLLSTPE